MSLCPQDASPVHVGIPEANWPIKKSVPNKGWNSSAKLKSYLYRFYAR